MTNKTYKAGDIVHVRLDEIDAQELAEGMLYVRNDQIIAHIPAPEPVVLYTNVYGYGYVALSGDLYKTRKEADRGAFPEGRTCVLRLEWPDGDTSKKPIVTVEDV